MHGQNHIKNVILISTQWQQWLHKRALMLRYIYTACPVYDVTCYINTSPCTNVLKITTP